MTRTKGERRSNRAEDIERLNAALAAFDLNYGRDETKLEKWQQLCVDCGLEHGRSVKKCKAVRLLRRGYYYPYIAKSKQLLRTVAVNIWDLIKARETGDLPVKTYGTKGELRRDLKNPTRRFPLARTKGSGENRLLSAFLVTTA